MDGVVNVCCANSVGIDVKGKGMNLRLKFSYLPPCLLE